MVRTRGNRLRKEGNIEDISDRGLTGDERKRGEREMNGVMERLAVLKKEKETIKRGQQEIKKITFWPQMSKL